MSQTYDRLQTFLTNQAQALHVIEDATLPNGAYKRLCQAAGTFTLQWFDRQGGALVYDYQTVQADEAASVYDGIDGVVRPWDEAYLPRGGSGHEGKTMTVFSVGVNPEGAIAGFLDGQGTELAKLVEFEPQAQGDYQWAARIQAKDGSAFRVAGRYVPGGAVLVWWK